MNTLFGTERKAIYRLALKLCILKYTENLTSKAFTSVQYKAGKKYPTSVRSVLQKIGNTTFTSVYWKRMYTPFTAGSRNLYYIHFSLLEKNVQYTPFTAGSGNLYYIHFSSAGKECTSVH
jgi:hypothetical protein